MVSLRPGFCFADRRVLVELVEPVEPVASICVFQGGDHAMRRLLLTLGVFCCMASAAMAGPNAGGVLWVHDIGPIYSDSDPVLPPVSPPPADCASVDNQMPVVVSPLPGGESGRFWKVYAAFPTGSTPRLKSVSWKTQFDENVSAPYSYVTVTFGGVPDADGAGTDFWIGAAGFPTASGGEVGQSFPTGPRTTTVVELFWFFGWGYSAGASYGFPAWCTVPYSDPTHRFFVDDATPPNADPIMGYGCLGFGVPGYTPCPNAPVPTERASWGQIKRSYR